MWATWLTKDYFNGRRAKDVNSGLDDRWLWVFVVWYSLDHRWMWVLFVWDVVLERGITKHSVCCYPVSLPKHLALHVPCTTAKTWRDMPHARQQKIIWTRPIQTHGNVWLLRVSELGRPWGESCINLTHKKFILISNNQMLGICKCRHSRRFLTVPTCKIHRKLNVSCYFSVTGYQSVLSNTK